MKLSNVPTPDVYRRESMDFRFFLHWFEESLSRIKYDHDHIIDLYDPLRCPKELLWILADTMGYKYDDRLPPAFCRLVLLYFISMIRLRGSKNGVTLAAEVNLAQHNINKYGSEKEILYNRLEDTSIPVNAVSVIPHVHEGYIEVVYFTDTEPIDACIEYVRPAGMYVFARSGVAIHARTKIWVDAMLTDRTDMNLSIGPTHVGHYSREDYARMQKMRDQHKTISSMANLDAVSAPKFDVLSPKFTPTAINNTAKIAFVTKDAAGNETETAMPANYSITYAQVTDADKSIMLVVTDSIRKDGVLHALKTYYNITVSARTFTAGDKYAYRTTGLKNVIPADGDGTSFDTAYTATIQLVQNRSYHTPEIDDTHTRKKVWYRNSKYEVEPDGEINPGYRALYNLQMSNNEHIVESLLPKMFSLGYGPQPGDTESDEYFEQNKDIREDRPWDIKNLRHRNIGDAFGDGWSYLDPDRPQSNTRPRPRVNPIFAKLGDSIAMSPNPLEDYDNAQYTKSDDPKDQGNDIHVKPQDQV